ncbi:MAG TPA: hypothetical protein VMI15_01680 [Burkholderiales bacterium]|nr:hypothetical protein [Burkholderiales bacterium]
MEQVKLKHQSDTSAFFELLAGFAVAALVMLGVGGTVYRLVSPGGWLASAFGFSFAGGVAAVTGLLVVGLSAWAAREWISARARNRYAEVFVYGFAAAGALYAFDLALRGAI